MNKANLHELINRYCENYYYVNDKEHDELFKLRAFKKFYNTWHSGKLDTMSFSKFFNEAKSYFLILTDNSRVSPANGIVKLAEKCEDEVKTLFTDVLFADAADADQIQNNMECFLEEIEKLRQKTMPQNWKYKQDRHSASCYLFFFNPTDNYIYRFSEAEEFAKYIEFGKDLGSGESFSLKNYYEMANIVVEALKEHPDLIDKHKKFIEGNEDYFYDESLHLMAFDLMYCCRCYNFYSGLSHATKKDSIKLYTQQQLREAEEKERAEKIQALEDEIRSISIQMEAFSDISLLGVEVSHKDYGNGLVFEQDRNKIKIHFKNCDKTFVIHKQFAMRPTFENDEEIVAAFTEYADLESKKKFIENQLKRLTGI